MISLSKKFKIILWVKINNKPSIINSKKVFKRIKSNFISMKGADGYVESICLFAYLYIGDHLALEPVA